MSSLKIPVIAGFLLITTHALCQVDPDSVPGFANFYSNKWMEEWYRSPSMIHLLDNFAEGAFVFNEANSGFARSDDLLLSIHNGSHRWNKFYLNNHRIDDILTPGTALLIPEPGQTDVEILPFESSLKFTRQFQKNRIDVQYDRGSMGGWIPGADKVIRFIYGHDSPRDRNVRRPFIHRRKVRYQYSLEADFSIPHSDSSASWHGFQLLTGKRNHTSFDFGGLTGTYPEKYISMDLKGQLAGEKWSYATGYRHRDNYLTEYGLNQEETSRLSSWFLSVFQTLPENAIIKNNGINLILKNVRHNQPGFARNIIDQDGEGLNPWYPSQNMTGISHHLKAEYPIDQKREWTAHWESYNSFIHCRPHHEKLVNPVFYQSSAEDFKSIYVNEFNFASFNSLLLENKLLIKYERALLNNSLKLNLGAGPSLDGFVLPGISKFTLNINASCSVNYRFNSGMVGLQFNRRPIQYHLDHIRFLSADHLSGNTYFWDDSNSDGMYQESEKSDLIRRTGGWVHSISAGLKQPTVYNMAIPLRFSLGSKWIIGFTGEYSSFRNLWTTGYELSPQTYGSNQEIGDYQIFFEEPGKIPVYELVSYRRDLIEKATGKKSFLFDQPFAASGLFQISHFAPQWWFYFSFRAYMVPGYGDVGNGPIHNGLDEQSESLANPNAYIHYYGRFAVDRSFITKLVLAYRASDLFSGVFQIKYKDGQPFNFIETAVLETAPGHNQVALWNEGIKGDNPFTGEFNSRTNGLWNIELRLAFHPKVSTGELTLEVIGYNLLDLGMSTREFTFAPATAGDRAALDLEIPRGISLGITWSWQ